MTEMQRIKDYDIFREKQVCEFFELKYSQLLTTISFDRVASAHFSLR
jgi:hypothetical protein